MSKQTRCAFSHSDIKTCNPLEMLHVDVWGPYRYSSHTGCIMFLTIVNDYIRATWVYLMKQRSEYMSIITQFVQILEKYFSLLVKYIRSDNTK